MRKRIYVSQGAPEEDGRKGPEGLHGAHGEASEGRGVAKGVVVGMKGPEPPGVQEAVLQVEPRVGHEAAEPRSRHL